jgi:hypothetical protein
MPAVIRSAMSDGRALTSYLSSCQLNAELQAKFNSRNDTEYRAQLQANPRAFDVAMKSYTDFAPYWPTNSCPEFAKAQAADLRKMPLRKS